MLPKISALLTATLLLGASAAAQADVAINNKATSNMSCIGGVCTATAKQAVLNVTELQTMLAGGDVAVKTGSVAKDISIDQPLSWSSTNGLILDAQRSVIVKKPVTVAGSGALTITYSDGVIDGNLYFFGKGKITFLDLGSNVVINGNNYSLVHDIKSLADAVSSNARGYYALAQDYDAKADGVYSATPVGSLSGKGTFEGLGHVISRFSENTSQKPGLFSDNYGTIRDFGLQNTRIIAGGGAAGTLAPENHGSVLAVFATGMLGGGIAIDQDAGGLIGRNKGGIVRSYADVTISTGRNSGGLVGLNLGSIWASYALGSVTAGGVGGGLAGRNSRSILESYSTGAVTAPVVGGFVGEALSDVTSSYSTGKVAGTQLIGGFVGDDVVGVQVDYWDLDASGVTDPGQGAGRPYDDPGITGLTTEQLQSDLPPSFDPKIWGSNPNINNGYPYLLANPPK